jgi:endogenous inhibitor of DNA gyrase (YacG/DUF329 family)
MISVRCPICERPLAGARPDEWPNYPFCSARCRMIDLGRWLGGEYAFEANPEEVDAEPFADEDRIP